MLVLHHCINGYSHSPLYNTCAAVNGFILCSVVCWLLMRLRVH